jgi:hypothetical protein
MPDQNDATDQQHETGQETPTDTAPHKKIGNGADQSVVGQRRIAEDAREQAAAETNETNEIIAKATKRTAWATVAIFVANVVFAFFAYEQWETSREFAHAQLRPYVVIRATDMTLPSSGEKMHVTLSLENVGNTPVYDGKLYETFEMSDNDRINQKPDRCNLTPPGEPPGAVFGKTLSFPIDAGAVTTKQQVDLIHASAAKMIFVARYCYSDIFREVNWTDLCIYWHASEDKVTADYCASYNSAVSGYRAVTPSGPASWLSPLLGR